MNAKSKILEAVKKALSVSTKAEVEQIVNQGNGIAEIFADNFGLQEDPGLRDELLDGLESNVAGVFQDDAGKDQETGFQEMGKIITKGRIINKSRNQPSNEEKG